MRCYHLPGGNDPRVTGPHQLHRRTGPDRPKAVADGVFGFRVNVIHFFCWPSATRPNRRLPIPKRPVPDRHSLQVLLQPVLLAEFAGPSEMSQS